MLCIIIESLIVSRLKTLIARVARHHNTLALSKWWKWKKLVKSCCINWPWCWLQASNYLSFASLLIHISIGLHAPDSLITPCSVRHKYLIFTSKVDHLQGRKLYNHHADVI